MSPRYSSRLPRKLPSCRGIAYLTSILPVMHQRDSIAVRMDGLFPCCPVCAGSRFLYADDCDGGGSSQSVARNGEYSMCRQVRRWSRHPVASVKQPLAMVGYNILLSACGTSHNSAVLLSVSRSRWGDLNIHTPSE
jgi:hypothetical protein